MLTLKLFFKRLSFYFPVLFAHKPFCERFRGDLFKFGKIYFCRSCFFLYLGFLFWGVTNIFFQIYLYDYYVSLSIFVGFIVCVGSFPLIYKFANRIIRDFLRFFLGITIANLIVIFLAKEYSYFL